MTESIEQVLLPNRNPRSTYKFITTTSQARLSRQNISIPRKTSNPIIFTTGQISSNWVCVRGFFEATEGEWAYPLLRDRAFRISPDQARKYGFERSYFILYIGFDEDGMDGYIYRVMGFRFTSWQRSQVNLYSSTYRIWIIGLLVYSSSVLVIYYSLTSHLTCLILW